MFLRLVRESFLRQRRRKLLSGAAILLGTTAVTAMLALATSIGDRIQKELAVYGANIVVTPAADSLAVKIGGVDIRPANAGVYIRESDLEKLKTIFWANNITGISPELPTSLETVNAGKSIQLPAVGMWFDHSFNTLRTGAGQLHPSWKVDGAWPVGMQQIAVGHELSQRLGLHLGSELALSHANSMLEPDPQEGVALSQDGVASSQDVPASPYKVVGIVAAGDATEGEILLPLEAAQRLNGTPNAVARVEISARTKPEDAFARVDPDSLPRRQREIWYCRPYANSIAYQIREAIPGAQAEQVRQVEQSEGTVLARISGLMWLVSAAALLAAGFAVSAAMAESVLERRGEIGLMRSLGASRASIALLFYTETGVLAVVTGSLGFLLGSGLSAWLGASIFAGDGGARAAIFNPVLLPVVVALALLVAIAGSTPSIRSTLRVNPSTILRGEA